MIAYILILVSLAGAPQTRCYENQAGWKQHKAMVEVPADSLAYYDPQYNYIALGPLACRAVRMPTYYGAWIYAHEIAHWNQDRNNVPFSEDKANAFADRTYNRWLRKLEDYFNRKGRQEIVRLRP